MSEESKLGELMRADWDRRIAHDYRFWMSDGHASDEVMWEAGSRDFAILTRGLSPSNSQTFLELGCGVGRILHTALKHYGRVIGVDVSNEAIERARKLLGKHQNLTLLVGNGVDLREIEDGSVDVATSFAALSSIPTPVVANYLREIHRVVKPNGTIRLQLYVGREQPVRKDDTLHVRCYREENLREALRLSGFVMNDMWELVLPLQVSFKEVGIEAVIVDLVKSDHPVADSDSIARALLPQGESESVEDTLGTDLEYWMTVNYAKELAERGDTEKARATLEYAERVQHSAALDVGDLLGRIVTKVDQIQPENSLQVRESDEGPVLYEDGQALDHPSKPRTAAQKWAARFLDDPNISSADSILIVGLGGGYHVGALLDEVARRGKNIKVFAIEPSESVAAKCRELNGGLLERLAGLSVGPEAELPKIEGKCEIHLRPQAIAVHPETCNRIKSRYYGARGLGLLKPSIGIVGPLQGGTLPMVSYTARALASLGQRMREFDLSTFDGGYSALERFVKDKGRRQSVENHYCEMLSQIVLESINEKPVDIVICMALAPLSPRVLTELRKRGIVTVLWFVEDYVRFTYWKQTAQYFDFVFTIQKGKCIEEMRKAGAGEVHYLPVGCDPIVHAPLTLSAEEKARWGSPVSFMGAGYHNRQQLLATLADMPLKIWGTEWPTCKPFDRLVQEGGRRLTPGEYVKVFNASDININLHSSHERDGVDPFGDFLNPRTFELASAGVFQLVDERSLLTECFEPGKEIITFKSGAELKEKIRYYLAHPEERRAVAEAARTRVLREHTYGHRLRDMLSIIYSSKFEHLRARADSSPWKRMMERSVKWDELRRRCAIAFERGEEPTLDALVSDIVTGQGKLTETEQKLLFLFHVRKQIIRMRAEESGGKK